MTDDQSPRRAGLRLRQADAAGRHPWVLEDDAGIVEIAESRATIAADHPELAAGEGADADQAAEGRRSAHTGRDG